MKAFIFDKRQSGSSLVSLLIASALLSFMASVIAQSTDIMFQVRNIALTRNAYLEIDEALRHHIQNEIRNLLIDPKYISEFKKVRLMSEGVGVQVVDSLDSAKHTNQYHPKCPSRIAFPQRNNQIFEFCVKLDIVFSEGDSGNKSSIRNASYIVGKYSVTILDSVTLRKINYTDFKNSPNSIARVESELYWEHKSKNNVAKLKDNRLINTKSTVFYVIPEWQLH